MLNQDDLALAKFIEYLRIKTVQPTPKYWEAKEFLGNYAKELGLEFKVAECVKDKPCCVMIWKGIDENRKSLILNSHMDVVPVFEEEWSHPPFSADIVDGKIYARGSQDMKCVGIQQVESIRRLISKGMKPLMNVYILFVPDEEIGGTDGLGAFVNGYKSENGLNQIEFAQLKPGLYLDEGLASPTNEFLAYYEERNQVWFEVTVFGNAGHGSQFINDLAIEKLNKIIEKLLEFRKEQEKIYSMNQELGSVTTLNITKISGGVQVNVIPNNLSFSVDMRITPSLDMNKVLDEITQLCRSIDEKCTIKILKSFLRKPIEDLREPDKNLDPSWNALHQVCTKYGSQLKLSIFPATTDARYIRANGIKAINFSPMKNTPILLHDHNEYITVDEFLLGCKIYEEFVGKLIQLESF